MAQVPFSRRRLLLIGAALAFSAALFLFAAEPAQAFPTSVGDMVGDAVKKIFGVKGDWITKSFVQWVITVPEVNLSSGTGPGQVYEVTRGMAFALLGAVLTLAVIHYMCVGMVGQGGGKNGVIGIDGAIRTGGAALMILAWPFLVENGVALSHIATETLIPGKELGHVTKTVFGLGSIGVGGGFPMIMVMLVMIAFSVVLLVVFVTKVMLGMALVCIACGMPLALALWPIPSLSWLANGMAKWAVAIPVVSVAWAVEIDVYSHVTMDAILFKADGPWVEKLIQPLTVVALLLLMLSTGKSILRLAGMPASGSGMATTVAAMMASRFGMNALSRVIPDRFGGMRDTLAQRAADATYRDMHGAASDLSSAQRARVGAERSRGSARAAMVDNENWMAEVDSKLQDPGAIPPPPPPEPRPTGGNPNGGGTTGNGDGPAEPPRPPLGQDGIPTRTGHQEAHRDSLERMDRLRAAGTSNSHVKVADALDTMQASGLDANAVASHIDTFGGSDRHVMGRMADAELARGLSPQAAGAYRTIGVAEPNARAAGLSLWQSRHAPAPSGNGNGHATRPTGPPKPASTGSATRPAGPPPEKSQS